MKQVYIKKSELFFIVFFLLMLVIAILSSFALPARFYVDTELIVYDIYHEIGWVGSYPVAISFYKYTGLRYLPFPIIALIQYPLMMYTLYKVGIPDDFHLLKTKNIIVYFCLFMIAVFMSMPSKEFMTFMYLAMIPKIIASEKFSKKRKIIYSSLVFISLGSFFRIYFLLIPVIAFGMYLLTYIKLKNKAVKVIFYGVIISIFMSLTYEMVKGEYLSASRNEVNGIRKVGADGTHTMINPPLEATTWYGEIVGDIYGFFAVNVPVEALKYVFSPQILAFVIWQFFFFYILLVRLSRSLDNREENFLLIWLLLFIFSYFIIQGLFEPDLGSAIRHKMGIFPVIYIALYYEHFRIKSRQNI